jgi:hypothetical protein
VYNTLVTPFGNIITNGLNNIVGPLTLGAAGAIEQLTAFLAQLTSGLPGANTPPFALASANSLPSEDTEFMAFSMASDEGGTDTKTAGPDVDATDTQDDGTIEGATVVDDVDLDAKGIDADSTGVEIDEPNEVKTNVLKDNPIDGYLSDAEGADPSNDNADDGTDTDRTDADVHDIDVGNDDAGNADTDTNNGTGDANGADGAGADAA